MMIGGIGTSLRTNCTVRKTHTTDPQLSCSVSYDEFSRKWNKPVHKWLLRHVYAQSMESYRLSKANATFVTFLFSSCLHELVLVIVTRRIRMYLFVLQMMQLPLIFLGRQPWVRKHSTVGNIVFWLGMFVGLPLLAILYCREAFWSSYIFGVGEGYWWKYFIIEIDEALLSIKYVARDM